MNAREKDNRNDDRDHGSNAWHALDTEAVLEQLGSSAEGLSTEEARQRLSQYGRNRLPEQKSRGPLRRFLGQFNNLLIIVLLVAAGLAGLLNHWVDAGVILGVVLLNALIGFVQEGKAEQALNAIRDMLAPRASILRDGERRQISAEELVPGDIVLLEPGDRVPADIRLRRNHSLQTQEAALTGESVPVEKIIAPVASDAALGDRRSMAYSGTLVTSGQAEGIVVATGGESEIGRISGMLADVDTMTTPLLQQMGVFSRRLTVVIGIVALLLFLYGFLLQDQSAGRMFMTVVGLAVAAIPEGLPAILTVTLAIGVQRMAARSAIIRRLPAVETLGAVSIICSDKTGTLTQNQMTVASLAVPEQRFSVTGSGYDPHGDFQLEEKRVEPEDQPALLELLRAGALCNDAGLSREGDTWTVTGDPMEGALRVAALKAGLDPDQQSKTLPRLDAIPFDAAHRFMATLHHDHEGHTLIYIKGAPEQILEMCSHEYGSDEPLDRDGWLERIEAMAAQGQRVLGGAMLRPDRPIKTLDFDDLKQGPQLLGLYGLMDPPRKEAISAINDCHSAGIRVKMITGDHATTARSIARELDLRNPDRVVTGHDLDQMDDAELGEIAPQVDVFARTSPEHKLRLVKALQARDEVVAMTGDGVNDAPALKRADIGVAMGLGGTEAAREASEMVLADDNFASIAAAVREGRTVYDNLKKAVLFLLPVNGGESISILLAVLLGLTLPITPLQILWVNMVSSVALAMALAFEPTEPDVMRRAPRARNEPILSLFLIWRILFVSSLFAAGIFAVFFSLTNTGESLEVARTHAVNALVVMEVFYLFNVRYLAGRSLTWQGIVGTRAVFIALTVVVALQLLFTYTPFMARFFDTRPVGITYGLIIIGLGVVLFAILEVEKALRRQWLRRKAVA